MQFQLDQDDGVNLIRAYDGHSLRLRDRVVEENVIVTADQVLPWRASDCADLRDSHVAEILSLRPDVILLGSGPQLIFPPQTATLLALGQGVGIEVMDTGAACRTYNILVMEGRKVAAALFL